MPFVLRLLSLSAAFTLTVALAACGDGEKTSSPSPSSGGSSVSRAPSNAQDTARVKLAQCLREQGVDVPDTEGHGAFAQLTPAERQQLESALRGPCREYQSGSFGDASDPQSQEFLDALTSFTVCLRKQGMDVPDPDPNNPFAVLHSLDQGDPKVAATSSACQDKLAALNGGG